MPQFYMYHPETGAKAFDDEKVSRDALVAQGWCDTPEKAGQAMSGVPGAQAEADRIQREVDEGRIPRLGKVPGHLVPDRDREAQREAEAAHAERERSRDALRGDQETETVAARAEEELADSRSDVAKARGRPAKADPAETAEQRDQRLDTKADQARKSKAKARQEKEQLADGEVLT